MRTVSKAATTSSAVRAAQNSAIRASILAGRDAAGEALQVGAVAEPISSITRRATDSAEADTATHRPSPQRQARGTV